MPLTKVPLLLVILPTSTLDCSLIIGSVPLFLLSSVEHIYPSRPESSFGRLTTQLNQPIVTLRGLARAVRS